MKEKLLIIVVFLVAYRFRLKGDWEGSPKIRYYQITNTIVILNKEKIRFTYS